VLRGVVTSGTGRRADIGRPAAGKTGTTQLWRDAWFAGYTPQLAAAVWMGSPKGLESMQGVAGVNVTGGSFPAQIWNAFMGAASAPMPVAEFSVPDATRWPAPTAIGSLPPGVPVPAGFALPPVTVPPVVEPPVEQPTVTTLPPDGEDKPTTTTTQRRKKRGRDG
jgi:penicillin-binding protein 1A